MRPNTVQRLPGLLILVETFVHHVAKDRPVCDTPNAIVRLMKFF